MASLLGNLEQIYHIDNEVDQVVTNVCLCWENRAGAVLRRDRRLKPKMVRVTVGSGEVVSLGQEPPPGGSETPPRSLYRSRLSPAGSIATTRCESHQGSVAARMLPGIESRTSGNYDLHATSILDKVDAPRPSSYMASCCTEEFTIPDFILMESPLLTQMLQERPRRRTGQVDSASTLTLRTVRRSSTLFHMVVALLKLRWLAKLQNAAIALGGRPCSLSQLVEGMLANTCRCQKHPHSPVQLCDLLVQTLSVRLGNAWPLFVGYVAGHDLDLMGTGAWSLSDTKWSDGEQLSGGAYGSCSGGGQVSRMFDQVFLAMLAQQDANQTQVADVFEELDYFGLARPEVDFGLDGLDAWQAALHIDAKPPKVVRKAQHEAHRLALLLELPEVYRSGMNYSLSQLVDLGWLVCGHPKTFNAPARARIQFNLEGCGFQGAARVPPVPLPGVAATLLSLMTPSERPSTSQLPISSRGGTNLSARGGTLSGHFETDLLFPSTTSSARVGTAFASSPPSLKTIELQEYGCYDAAASMNEEQASTLTTHCSYPRDCGRLPEKTLATWRDGKPPLLGGGSKGRVAGRTQRWLEEMRAATIRPRTAGECFTAWKP